MENHRLIERDSVAVFAGSRVRLFWLWNSPAVSAILTLVVAVVDLSPETADDSFYAPRTWRGVLVGHRRLVL